MRGLLSKPIGLSPLSLLLSINPLPQEVSVPMGIAPPIARIYQSCLSSPPHTPFLSLRRLCQRSPRTVPVFTALCQVHTEEGHGPPLLLAPCSSPLARGVQADTACRQWRNPLQRRLLGPRIST